MRHPRCRPALIAIAALLHAVQEYQFILSFPNYRFGGISGFFVLQGVISAADALCSKLLANTVFSRLYTSLPTVAKSLLVCTAVSPTVPFFAGIWIKEGMFSAIAQLAPTLKI